MDLQTTATAVSVTSPRGAARTFGLLLELAKFRLSGLVVLTTVVGFIAARQPHTPPLVLVWAVLGTALAAAGANTLNQWLEADRDARMERTRQRPLPSGRMSRREALAWGSGLAVAGPLVLWLGTNLLTAALGAAVVLLYVAVYTPMKVRTPLNTLIGAVCGAIPPVMGWTAAAGSVGAGALVLGGILFLWQIPHFLALAWLYRDDYRRGGFRMLPAVDAGGTLTGRLVVVYSLALLPLSAAAAVMGMTGITFLVGSQLLALPLVWLGLRLGARRSQQRARRLFFATLLYLPLVLGLLVVDLRSPHDGPRLAHVPTVTAASPLAQASAPADEAASAPLRF